MPSGTGGDVHLARVIARQIQAHVHAGPGRLVAPLLEKLHRAGIFLRHPLEQVVGPLAQHHLGVPLAFGVLLRLGQQLAPQPPAPEAFPTHSSGRESPWSTAAPASAPPSHRVKTFPCSKASKEKNHSRERG